MHLSGGSGAQMFYESRPLGGLISPAESIVLEGSLASRGWTHLQVVPGIAKALPPPLEATDGARAWNVTLANGFSSSGMEVNPAKMDYVGTFHDQPGRFRAEYVFLESDLGRIVGLLHFPTRAGDVPAGFAVPGYTEWG